MTRGIPHSMLDPQRFHRIELPTVSNGRATVCTPHRSTDTAWVPAGDTGTLNVHLEPARSEIPDSTQHP